MPRPAPNVARLPLPHLSVLVGLTLAVGCTTSGTDDSIPTCASNADCTDGDACMDVFCGADDICHAEPLPDGPVGSQVPGDCLMSGCQGGQYGEWVANDPFDDGNPCTVDSCSYGKPSNTPLPEGALCAITESDSGTCGAPAGDPAGFECLNVCSPPGTEECDDANPCTTDGCDESADDCTHENLADGEAPASAQTAGDCLVVMCVSGAEETQPDPADTPEGGAC